ncbi:MAG TPA: sensor histidine kinase [Acidimicrobiales bacterium]
MAALRDLLRPWRQPRTWWALTHLLLWGPASTVTFVVIFTLLVTSVALLITFPLAIPVMWALFVAARILGTVERSRYEALLGERIADPVPPLQRPSWWGRLWERVRTPARWREIGYLLLLPVGLPFMILTGLVWCGAAALIGLPFYVDHLPGGTAKFWLFEVGPGAGAVAAALVGVVGLVVVAPWVTLGLARAATAVGRRLLGPRPKGELDERVEALETSRAAAVDSAEAERRRIERDLHDGAQQRLVSLAMGLGAARQRLEEDHEAGRRMVAEAHEEAKAALRELRDLVRGIHPVILEDRGLDAALSAVVARASVPVQLEVTVPERPSAAVESAAYFVVMEALTNVAKHAQASRAWVTIERAGDRLVVEVRDDGRGGADMTKGTGLAGLHNRVTGLGGTMHVVSPEGGPTTLLVELPCAS